MRHNFKPGRPKRGDSRVEGAAGGALASIVRAGAEAYDRRRDLPRLIHIDPQSAPGDTGDALMAIVARLERSLRAERAKARSGHWTYDLNRHIALRQAYVAESERLAALQARTPASVR